MTDIRELLRAADEVRAPDLWAEIRARAAETVTAPAPPRAPSLPRRRLVPAAAIVLAAVVAAVVTLSIPRPQSAQAIITQAIRDFEHAPPFRAEVVGRIPAALLPGDGEQAAGAYRYRVWYRGQDGWRLELLEDTVPFAGLGGPGSVQVWNGREYVVYNASRRTSSTGSALPEGFSPLGVLGWNPLALQAVKELEGPRVSREGPDCRDSQVFEDAQIAGRRARHVRCDAFELWIDAETGLDRKSVV